MSKVIVYTVNYCPYCDMVKRLLQDHEVPFEEIDFTDNDELRERIAKESGQLTAPQVFLDGKPLGGYVEIKKLADDGQLESLFRP